MVKIIANNSDSIETMGCCCSRNDDKEKTLKKMRIIKKLADSKRNKAVERLSSPSTLKTSQLTAIYKLPTEEFKTCDDVLKHYGYEIGRIIGMGTFAKVYKAQHLSTNATVAVKVVEPKKDKKEKKKYLVSIRNELFVLQKVRHRNVVQVIEHFIIDDSLYIFMEYASGGNLSEVVGRDRTTFTEQQSKQMFAQILSGVSKMHSENIAHRDLKLSNILIAEDERLLISDFGLSRVVYRTNGGVVESNTFCGTQPYLSPEILEGKKYNPFLLDIWALGVILYCLLNSRYPFSPEKSNKWIVKQQKRRNWSFGTKAKQKPTKELINILDQMLEPNLAKRIEMKDLIKDLWIKDEFNKAQTEAQNMEMTESKVDNETMRTA